MQDLTSSEDAEEPDRAYHTPPLQQPGETGSLRPQEQPCDSRLGAQQGLSTSWCPAPGDAAACPVQLHGLCLRGKRNPWLAVANWTVLPLYLPVFGVLLQKCWVCFTHPYLQIDCAGCATSPLHTTRKKASAGISQLPADPSAFFSHISIYFSLYPVFQKKIHGFCPGSRVLLVHSFSLLYLDVAELLEEYQGGWLGQRGDLCRGQEEADGLFMQGKGCGKKNLSCAFLNSGSHVALVVSWSCRWTFCCGTANNCIYRLKSAQSATCQPQLWPGQKGKVLCTWVTSACFVSKQFVRQHFEQATFNPWSGNTNSFPPKCQRASPMPLWGFTWPGFYKVALSFAGWGRHLPQCDYF